ncbi:MAG: hypothetical protein KOO60_10775 [Gemmatimonadales bacterium]|nr:hypothetical protein [Gemmatimonadales bacterium]
MRYDEPTVQILSEHLNGMAGNEYGVEVVPVRVERGVWCFGVTDKVGGNWKTEGTKTGYDKIKAWILSGY